MKPIDIEIGISNTCYRNCSFCPQSSTEWKKDHSIPDMTVSTAHVIAERLREANFDRNLYICGHGEPFCNNDWEQIFCAFRDFNTTLITSGTFLTNSRLKQIQDTGIKNLITSHVRVNGLFRGERVKSKLDLPKYYNNRAFFQTPCANKGICYLPFYRMYIQPDGTYNFCSNDFSELNCGVNVFNCSIDQWFNGHQLEQFRQNLIKTRDLNQNCSRCDCIGTLGGKQAFDEYINSR